MRQYKVEMGLVYRNTVCVSASDEAQAVRRVREMMHAKGLGITSVNVNDHAKWTVNAIADFDDGFSEQTWMTIFDNHLRACFLFWLREHARYYHGRSSLTLHAFADALNEVRRLRHDPFVPQGQPVPLNVLEEWCDRYDGVYQEMMTLYDDVRDSLDIGRIRVCRECGIPMVEGFEVDGEPYCSCQCATHAKFRGDVAAFAVAFKTRGDKCSKMKWDSVLLESDMKDGLD